MVDSLGSWLEEYIPGVRIKWYPSWSFLIQDSCIVGIIWLWFRDVEPVDWYTGWGGFLRASPSGTLRVSCKSRNLY